MTYFLTVPPLCVAALAMTLLGGVNRDGLKAAYRHVEAGGIVEMAGCSVGAGRGDVSIDPALISAIYPWRYDGKWLALVEKVGQLTQGYCADVNLNPQDDTLIVCVEGNEDGSRSGGVAPALVPPIASN